VIVFDGLNAIQRSPVDTREVVIVHTVSGRCLRQLLRSLKTPFLRAALWFPCGQFAHAQQPLRGGLPHDAAWELALVFRREADQPQCCAGPFGSRCEQRARFAFARCWCIEGSA
jgi:hypothetical protein